MFPSLIKEVGIDRAIETVRFSEANIRRLKDPTALLSLEEREAVEFRNVISTTGLEDQESFEEAVDGLKQLLKAVPDSGIKYQLCNKEDASKVRESMIYMI